MLNNMSTTLPPIFPARRGVSGRTSRSVGSRRHLNANKSEALKASRYANRLIAMHYSNSCFVVIAVVCKVAKDSVGSSVRVLGWEVILRNCSVISFAFPFLRV